MDITVNDNWVYSRFIDPIHSKIIFHTVDERREPLEYADVIFSGVVAHHFGRPYVGDCLSNVLFSICQADSKHVLGQFGDLLSHAKNYGWPLPGYRDLDDLAAKLATNNVQCFDVDGSSGVNGFVFASTMEIVARDSRATNGG